MPQGGRPAAGRGRRAGAGRPRRATARRAGAGLVPRPAAVPSQAVPEQIGVRSGLPPLQVPRSQLQGEGRWFETARGIAPAALSPPTAELWLAAVRGAAPVGLRPNTRYESHALLSAGRRTADSPRRAAAIGLAGEVAALEWVKARYRGTTDDAWVSGYRNQVRGDGRGRRQLLARQEGAEGRPAPGPRGSSSHLSRGFGGTVPPCTGGPEPTRRDCRPRRAGPGSPRPSARSVGSTLYLPSGTSRQNAPLPQVTSAMVEPSGTNSRRMSANRGALSPIWTLVTTSLVLAPSGRFRPLLSAGKLSVLMGVSSKSGCWSMLRSLPRRGGRGGVGQGPRTGSSEAVLTRPTSRVAAARQMGGNRGAESSSRSLQRFKPRALPFGCWGRRRRRRVESAR